MMSDSQPIHSIEQSPDGSVLSRRQRKALAARRALLDAGLRAFQRQPIALVSVLDITEASDVAKGVFYLHFRSKDDYLIQLWCELRDQLLDEIQQHTATRKSVHARIDAYASVLHAFAREHVAGSMFWMRMASYLPGEVGEPGQLLQARCAYLDSVTQFVLAGKVSAQNRAVLAPLPSADPPPLPEQARQMAKLDATAWGMIHHALRFDYALPDEATFLQIIRATHRTVRKAEAT